MSLSSEIEALREGDLRHRIAILPDVVTPHAAIAINVASANDLPLFANSGRCPSGGGLTD